MYMPGYMGTTEMRMPYPAQPSSELAIAKKQIVPGLVVIFAIYFSSNYFIQTSVIARPRMAADLNGMAPCMPGQSRSRPWPRLL
jgi:hypothetical protein